MIQRLTSKNYLEIYEFLHRLGTEYIEKIPKKVYNFIEENKLKNHTILDDNLAISKETISFIALLHYNYWCKTEQEKQELSNIFKENEEESDKELHEKYNIDVFAKKDNIQTKQKNEDTQEMIAIEENWYKKITIFIRNILWRIKNGRKKR